jgi:hypothetical protein
VNRSFLSSLAATWRQYGEDLERKLADLHARIHRGAYRAQLPAQQPPKITAGGPASPSPP